MEIGTTFLQDTAVAVIESFGSYDQNRPFVAWAIGVARNQVGLYLRRRQRERLVFDDETVACLALPHLRRLRRRNLRQLDFLQDCLRSLEGRARKLLEFRYQADLKPAAIADRVGMTANTVAKALQRIRDQLKECIERKSAEAAIL